MSQPVLLLDDGELDDIQELLEELNVSFARVRGGAIIQGQPQPSKLLVATPRRIDAVAATQVTAGERDPLRVVVVEEDSVGMREQLRQIGFDYMVRRPVHNEALRLLLLHCLYSGEERRDEPRVPVGFEVPVKTGIIPRRATLADLSASGCRLLSTFPLEPGKRIKVRIPEALGVEESLALSGRIVRMSLEERRNEDNLYNSAVIFDELRDDKRAKLEGVLQERAEGPPTLAYVEQPATGDVRLGPMPLEKERAKTTGGWREINRAAQRDPRAEPEDTRAPETLQPEFSAPPELEATPEPAPPRAETSRPAIELEPEAEPSLEPHDTDLEPEDASDTYGTAYETESTPEPTVVDAPSYEALVAEQRAREAERAEEASEDAEQAQPWPSSTPTSDMDPVRSELKGLAAMLAASTRGEREPEPSRPEAPRPEGKRESGGPGGSLAASLRNLSRDAKSEAAEPELPEQTAPPTPPESADPEMDIAQPSPLFAREDGPNPVAETSAPSVVADAAAPQTTEDAPEPDLATQEPNAMERRKDTRGAFDVKVPAFGSRALRVLVGRDISRGGMRVEHSPDLDIGDRLHLAIYGEAGEEPFLVWATIVRDDAARGMGLVFDEVHGDLSERLDKLVGGLPAVESLHDDEATAMGTVMSEILAR